MVDLKRARERIQRELARLQNRTEKVDRDLRRENNPLSSDWSEQTVVRENDEVLNALHLEGHEQIQQLEEALQRIESGAYGVCSECEGGIDEARLEGLPQATLCIGCARTREQ